MGRVVSRRSASLSHVIRYKDPANSPLILKIIVLKAVSEVTPTRYFPHIIREFATGG